MTSSSVPRRHHFVPQFLLRRWANERDQVEVHRLEGQGRPFLSNVRDIGHRTDGHTVSRRGGEPDRCTFEEQMSEVEQLAAEAIVRLDSRGSIDPDTREALEWFLGLQWSRHRHLFNQIASEVDDHGRSAQDLQSSLLRVKLVPLFSARQASQDPTARPKDQWDPVVGDLNGFTWHVARFRSNALLLGDNLLCFNGVRPGGISQYGPVWAAHGLGLPMREAKRLTIPLGPRLGLLLTREGARSRIDAAEFNRSTIFNSREFVLHPPGWLAEPTRLTRHFAADIERQRFVAKAFIKGPY